MNEQELENYNTHKTRASDASSYDEVCTCCGATDISGNGWGKLTQPCPNREDVNEVK